MRTGFRTHGRGRKHTSPPTYIAENLGVNGGAFQYRKYSPSQSTDPLDMSKSKLEVICGGSETAHEKDLTTQLQTPR